MAARPDELPSARLATRIRMYALMMGSTLTIKTVRYAIPLLAPFVVEDLSLGDTDLANMLGAFFPGCTRSAPKPAPLVLFALTAGAKC